MANRRDDQPSRRPPARNPLEREQRLVGLAADLAERQLSDGTATAQVITHYLKLGSSREYLEQEKLEREVELLAMKREVMESAKRVEELYGAALAAMRDYAGQSSDEDEELYD